MTNPWLNPLKYLQVSLGLIEIVLYELAGFWEKGEYCTMDMKKTGDTCHLFHPFAGISISRIIR